MSIRSNPIRRVRLVQAQGDQANSIVEAAAEAFATEAARDGDSDSDYNEALAAARVRCRSQLESANDVPLGGVFSVRGTGDVNYGAIWLVARNDPIENCRHILWLTINVEHRRRGVALATIRHVIHQAECFDIPALTLNVFARNSAATALYRRCGFKRYDRGMILRLLPGSSDSSRQI